MGSKERIAQRLTAISGALLLAIFGFRVHAQEAAPPAPPQATALSGAPGAPGRGRGGRGEMGRPAAGFYIRAE